MEEEEAAWSGRCKPFLQRGEARRPPQEEVGVSSGRSVAADTDGLQRQRKRRRRRGGREWLDGGGGGRVGG